MHREYDDFNGVHVYLRSNRISLVLTKIILFGFDQDRSPLFKGETKVALNNVESNFGVIETEVYALEIYYAR